MNYLSHAEARKANRPRKCVAVFASCFAMLALGIAFDFSGWIFYSIGLSFTGLMTLLAFNSYCFHLSQKEKRVSG